MSTTSPSRAEIAVAGLTTSYLQAGDEAAPLVVLLHDGAWGGSAEATWGRVIPVVAERFRVLAPDLYGYGRSSKMVQLDVAPYEFRLRQVAGLLDALGYGAAPAHVVGSSFGGAMALRGATLPWFAWRMRSAVSISGTGGPYRTEQSLEALGRFDGSSSDMMRIVRLLTGDFDGIADYVESRARGAASAAHFRAVAAAGLATPFSRSTGMADDYPQSLHGVRMPVALVAGTEDDLVEPGWAARIAEHGPSCRVYEIATRHSPNISDPVGTGRLLLDILGEHEGSWSQSEGPGARTERHDVHPHRGSGL